MTWSKHRTQTINHLHVLLVRLIPAGAPTNLTADVTAGLLRRVRSRNPVHATLRALAVELVAEIGHLDRRISESPRVLWRLGLLVSGPGGDGCSVGLGRVVCPVFGFEFGGWDQSDLAVEASVVEPVGVFGDGKFDVADRFPAAVGTHDRVADALRLEEAVECLSHRVIVGIAFAANGCDRFGFGQAFGVADGSVLTGFNRSMQHRLVGARVVVR